MEETLSKENKEAADRTLHSIISGSNLTTSVFLGGKDLR